MNGEFLISNQSIAFFYIITRDAPEPPMKKHQHPGSAQQGQQQRGIPTAVFCANDLTAVGAIRALKSVGLRVTADVSIVGFDDDEVAQICAVPQKRR